MDTLIQRIGSQELYALDKFFYSGHDAYPDINPIHRRLLNDPRLHNFYLFDPNSNSHTKEINLNKINLTHSIFETKRIKKIYHLPGFVLDHSGQVHICDKIDNNLIVLKQNILS